MAAGLSVCQTESVFEPVDSGVRVEQRFLCRKGLTGHDNQCGFGIQLPKRRQYLGAIDVGDKVHIQVRLRVLSERLASEFRAKIGTAYADIDHVGHRFSGTAKPLAGANFVTDARYLLALSAHLGRALSMLSRIAKMFVSGVVLGHTAKCSVQYRAVFRSIDRFTVKHRTAMRRQR